MRGRPPARIVAGTGPAPSERMSPERRTRIAVVNDDPEFLGLLDHLLEQEGPYEVFTFRDEETRLGEIRAIAPEVIIIDVLTASLPSGWELALLAGADRELGSVPVIVTSPDVPGLGHRVEELRAVANVRVVSKPFTIEELRRVVTEALAEAGPADRGTPSEPTP
jgi:DNA-binding response OmpR family regulator